jgi:8-oxo-dGTP pyrophosphatase MutT (NUDIX family)
MGFGIYRSFLPAPEHHRMPSAYCVLYSKNNVTAVLVARKSANMPNNPGQQVFPGGRVNPGENRRHAALRELREETRVGVDVLLTTLTGVESYPIRDIYTEDFAGYSATYVKLDLEDLTSIRWDIHALLGKADGELISVDVVTPLQARATFIMEHVQGDDTQSTEWFRKIAENDKFR